MVSRPLEGFKVVEWSTFVAAPSCGRMLGELGAEVIKIESGKGDAWRYYGTSMKIPITDDENPVFDVVNSGKKSVVLDLRAEKGREVLLKLLEDCDIFLTNTRAKSLRKLKLDYESLHERFPKLIYATLTGFGETGPEVDSPGFDNVAFWGKSGFLADQAIQTEHSYPMLGPTGVGDMITGTTLLSGILASVIKRSRTGAGEYVTASLYGTAIWHMNDMILRAQSRYGDEFPKRRETQNPLVCPYKCADGEWLMLTILEFSRYFASLCTITGNTDLINDPRFATNVAMLENRAELIRRLEASFSTRTADEWKADLIAANMVCEKLPHYADVEHSEQAWANNFIEKFEFGNGGNCAMPCPSIRFSSTPLSHTRRGPLLAEDTKAVLERLGYNAEEISAMAASGAVNLRKNG